MAIFTSKASGNWDAAGQTTWNEVGTPTTNQDSVTINAGHTVTGNANFTLAAGATLTVAATGVLNVDTTHTITFNATSIVANAGTIDFADTGATVTLDGAWSGAGGVSVATSVVFTAGMSWVGYTGSFTFDSTSLARTVTYNAVSGPKLIVTNSGTTSLTAQDACTAAAFSISASAVYADGGLAHNIGAASVTTGIIINAAATLTTTGVWTLTASGNLANSATGNRVGNLTIPASVTGTLIGTFWCKALSGSGIIALGNLDLAVGIVANDAYAFTGTFTTGTGKLQLSAAGDHSIAAAVSCPGVDLLTTILVANKTLTVAGRISCKALTVYGGAGNYVALVANGGVTATGAVALGLTATTRIGKLTLGGICSFASGFNRAAGSTATTNELNLGSSYLTLTGTLDGTGVLFSNTACALQGGTVSNLTDDPTVKIHAYGATDGGGNTAAYIDFDKHAPPGSLAMSGVGI